MKKLEDIFAFLLIAFSLLGCLVPVLFYGCIPVSIAVVLHSIFDHGEYEPMIPVADVLAAMQAPVLRKSVLR